MHGQIYDPSTIETKWQEYWEQHELFQHSEQQSATAEDKMYLLFAFAYPSGSGLHVGHVESKTALDILARYYRMSGKDVFFPVGWDAFGLPAENYAVKTGVHPAQTTITAIDTFRRQIKRVGISYDWANEVATSHPEYYKWTQWLFLQLYHKGLAYRGQGMVNWCPSCQTVLANEQVVNGECERCGFKVIQKELEQWYFKITQYQDELLSGLEHVDWPEATKHHQKHWIGKSQGALLHFPLLIEGGVQIEGQELMDGQQTDEKLSVFSTAHDTIYGCTFMVVAPEHKLLKEHQSQIKNWPEVEAYLEQAKKKTELDRQVQKEKTGIKVEGIELKHPLTGQTIPLYVADYVLGGYGTGAIMAVPGHDDRDFEFAQKYNLPVIYVTQEQLFISYSEEIKPNLSQYIMAESGEFSGMSFAEGRRAILTKLEENQIGEAKNEYKLRDWLISRQRYWGAPIPIVYDPEGNPHPVKEEHLPWLLPTDVEFKPTGESPLKLSKEFVERTEKLYGPGWRPEYDTMDTFVDSSWYYLRYVDSRNHQAFASPEQLKKWMPVDMYMIGPEHIVLHLLYSRFFTKFLRDAGYLNFDEPFMKMRHQGMILGPDNKKMSKSKGNVINPDEVIEKFGADTLRVYEMFMGPLEADKPWNVTAVAGVYRFLTRVHKIMTEAIEASAEGESAEETAREIEKESADALTRAIHQALDKVTQDIPKLKFNTAIAAMMEMVNRLERADRPLIKPEASLCIRMLAPFAPFLAEELWHQLQGDSASSIHLESWPTVNPEYLTHEVVTIAVQVNGKLRATMEVESNLTENQLAIEARALASEDVQRWIKGAPLKKVVYVPGKLLSLVV